MDEDEEPQGWKQAAVRAAIWFLVLISPLGAPLVGFAIAFGCDMPAEGTPQCFLPSPLIDYFLMCTMFSFSLGPLAGMLWLLLALVVLFNVLRHTAKTIWLASADM